MGELSKAPKCTHGLLLRAGLIRVRVRRRRVRR